MLLGGYRWMNAALGAIHQFYSADFSIKPADCSSPTADVSDYCLPLRYSRAEDNQVNQ